MKNSDTPAMPSSLEIMDAGHLEISTLPELITYNSGLTKREQACITLGIPESGDPELDELIIKSERKRISAMVMQGLISADTENEWNDRPLVIQAISCADALLERLQE